MEISWVTICVCVCVYVCVCGEKWLGYEGIQSIMQANRQGGKEKGELYSALPEKLFAAPSICEIFVN